MPELYKPGMMKRQADTDRQPDTGNTLTLKVKVCGMRDPQNLEQVCTLTPDYIGYIFYARSRRFVGSDPDPALFEIPGAGIKKAGVFVDEELSVVRRAIASYGLQAVQLHGGEPPAYCQSLSGEQVEVIKVLDPRSSRSELERYSGVADLFLFDSAGAGHGGSGLKFDWRLLGDLQPVAPFLLSGGIGPGDAPAIRSLRLGNLKGVDVNSRFERSPGWKDVDLLRPFIKEIRK
jgi:phosphoribosylanthranilate isomerase